MQIVRTSAVLLSLSLFACGDDGGPKLIDSGIGNTDAAPKVCTQITLGAGEVYSEAIGSRISWFNNINEMVGTNMAGLFSEFYHSVTPNITGAIDLAAGDQAGYDTCGICFLVVTGSGMTAGPSFFQQSGTVTFSEDPVTARRLNVTVSNIRLQEANIDPDTFATTFLPNGDCVILNGTFMQDNVPADWDNSTAGCMGGWYEGMDTSDCNCSCGLFEPDCGRPGAGERTQGCSGGTTTCWPDETAETACVAPVANDTCATAATLTIDAASPTAGNTKGADRDYGSTTGTTTCTVDEMNQGWGQAGPDVVYKATLTAGTQYQVQVVAQTTAWDPSIAIVGPDPENDASECTPTINMCAKGSDLDAKGGTETVLYTPATTGTYYFIVDTYFTALSTMDPDPANHVDLAGAFTIHVTTP